MKTEHIPLSVAAIAAAPSIGAVSYNQYSAGELETRKWEQSQQDALQAVVVDFAKELASAHQRAHWLVWRANHDSVALTQEDFAAFNSEAKAQLPRIFGYKVLLGAKHQSAYAAVDPIVVKYYAADACIGLAAAKFRLNRTQGIAGLLACEPLVVAVTDGLPIAFGKAMLYAVNKPAGAR